MTMTTEHSVAPEDVMALLDGELSAADARVVQAHLEECDECRGLAERLRGTSESLSQWSVRAVPRAVEKAVVKRVETADSRRERTKRKKLLSWKLLAAGSWGLALVMGLLIVFGPGGYRRARMFDHGSQANTKSSNQNDRLQYLVPPPPQALYEQMGRAQQTIEFKGRGLEQPGKGPIGKLQDKSRERQVFHSVDTRPQAGIAGSGVMASSQDTNLTASAPMIARSVSLSIRVKDANAARSSLDSIVARHHGYPAQLSMNSPENAANYAQASLRIPGDELASAVAEIRALGRVETESQSGEEVSQQHADLIARLRTARETEARFQAILQQRTGKISDVLEVEQNIARVRAEIEAMEAEQKVLEHRVDFATVEVVLSEEYKAQLGSQPDSVSTRVHNAFVAGYHNATETLLGIMLFAEEYGPPVLIWLTILGVPAVMIWRRYKTIRATR